ncbi:hypothetical protein PYCCODRAFT_1245600 [Trametes coccinea BRFM310]|uniref:Fe2OG dioxygenase domain-containing protein n=1 Tax=Trametes coccinea (strain BRFM310) TaxID=1353009 RepID=A0A1Y2IZ89_TRAC3|nr:hypothetical protein PYCCODRAFT_1245600 [Trametes coccinea BRFM310]
MPAAFKILKALKELTRLPCIGYSPTREKAQLQKMQESFPNYALDSFKSSEKARRMSTQQTPKTRHNAKCFTALRDLCERRYATGYLNHPFRLRITRPGCEFDAVISPTRVSTTSDADEAALTSLEGLLQRWYDNATVSGYGDSTEQAGTDIDPDVLDAREIPASEFIVDRELLHQVEYTWQKQFVACDAVRAVPYKIHLYGPGGQIEEHHDTPELGLVGTFLVGLGDTSTGGGLFLMNKPGGGPRNGKRLTAHPGEWCAFYPDAPYRVKRISGGYRAVMAFKIFPAEGLVSETEKARMLRQKIVEVVKDMEPTYGILLDHKYCLRTEPFSGFDAILLDAIRSVNGVVVHHLPVAVSFYAQWGNDTDCGYRSDGDWSMYVTTSVYPFASSYLDLWERRQGRRPLSDPDVHERCGCPWLKDQWKIPFFSLDLSQSLYEAGGGGEVVSCSPWGDAEGWQEDYEYLSYALVVLKADEGGVSKAHSESEDSESSDAA